MFGCSIGIRAPSVCEIVSLLYITLTEAGTRDFSNLEFEIEIEIAIGIGIGI